MKAVVFNSTGALSNIRIENISSTGPLEAGKVRMRFISGSLNHLDLWVLKGLPHLTYQFPHIMGADFCGKVLESQSDLFKEGDRVLLYPGESSGKNLRGKMCPENLCEDFKIRGESAPGVFREEYTVEDRYLTKAPTHLSDVEAGAIPLAYLTAWQMVSEKAEINFDHLSDDPILLHGAGSGVTHALLELLLSFGQTQLVVTSRDSKKLKTWEARGVLGLRFDNSLVSKLKKWKFGVIFDHVGQAHFSMNTRLLKNGGKLITCGATSGFKAELDLRHLFFRQLFLMGSTMGSLRHFKEVVSWIQQSKLKPIISHEIPFEGAPQAFGLLAEGAQSGKIVLHAMQ